MQVEVSYSVLQKDAVKLGVYSTNGTLVKELVNAAQAAGSYKAMWDGLDKGGAKVSMGVYWMVLDRGSQRFTKMVMLVK